MLFMQILIIRVRFATSCGGNLSFDMMVTIAMRADLLHPGAAPLMRRGAPAAGAPWPEPVDA
jgi:hypothetical protein